MNRTERYDGYQAITDRITAALEKGTVPWQKPWTAARGGRPRSMSTGRPYHGINVLLLGLTAADEGYTSPCWATYRQIAELGGNVRKGEHGTKVVFFKPLVVRDEKAEGEDKTKTVPLLRTYTVFNAQQADGLPERFYPEPASVQPVASAQEVLDAYLASPGAAQVRYDVHGRAYYQPGPDVVHLPPIGEHKSAADFYSTAFHEVAHSTGHPSRLNRPGIAQFDHFGSERYGREELAAQMGASFLLAETGTDTAPVMDNSAAYIASWLKAIKADKKMIVSAAAAGQKIAGHVLAAIGATGADDAGDAAALAVAA